MLRKVQTKTSASLLYSNLSCNGKSMAYVHNVEVIIAPDSSVLTGNATPPVVRVPVKDLCDNGGSSIDRRIGFNEPFAQHSNGLVGKGRSAPRRQLS